MKVFSKITYNNTYINKYNNILRKHRLFIVKVIKKEYYKFIKENKYFRALLFTDSIDDDLDAIRKKVKELIKDNLAITIASLPALFSIIQKSSIEGVYNSLGFKSNKFYNENHNAGVLTETELFKEEKKLIIHDNVRLIQSINEKLLDDVETVITKAINNGYSVRELTQELQKKFDATKWQAERIARDQILKYRSKVTIMKLSQLGITEAIWDTVGDERTRESHHVLHNKVISLSDSTIYKDTVNSEKWKKRSSIGGVQLQAGQDYLCRCTIIPLINN